MAEQREVQGVNSRKDLALVEDALQERLREAAPAMGATLRAPETIFLSEDTIIEQDVIIEQHVVIARGCQLKQGAHVAFCHLEGIVGADAMIDPMHAFVPEQNRTECKNW